MPSNRISFTALLVVAVTAIGAPRVLERRARSTLPSLLFQPCNATASQIFVVADGAVKWSPEGGPPLCVTFDAIAGYDSPLVLALCLGGAPNQSWTYKPAPDSSFSNAPGACAGPDNACLEWSGQESGTCTSTPPVLGAGCRIGTWPTSSPTTWNDQFVYGGSAGAGTIEAVWASADGPSPSGQCATVVTPPPPVPPTADILAWSEKEVMCLYGARVGGRVSDCDACVSAPLLLLRCADFDMCTMVTSQGCNCAAAPPPVSTWNVPSLDTDSWLSAGISAGCKIHILVAKHMCGWLLWPSRVGEAVGYNYSTAYAAQPVDVVAAFAASAAKLGQEIGMYYSLTNNARTNTCAGQVRSAGRRALSLSALTASVPALAGRSDPVPGADRRDRRRVRRHRRGAPRGAVGQLRAADGGLVSCGPESWAPGRGERPSCPGKVARAARAPSWRRFDGGFTPTLAANVSALLARLQPHAVGFNAGGLMPSPSRWIGSVRDSVEALPPRGTPPTPPTPPRHLHAGVWLRSVPDVVDVRLQRLWRRGPRQPRLVPCRD